VTVSHFNYYAFKIFLARVTIKNTLFSEPTQQSKQIKCKTDEAESTTPAGDHHLGRAESHFTIISSPPGEGRGVDYEVFAGLLAIFF